MTASHARAPGSAALSSLVGAAGSILLLGWLVLPGLLALLIALRLALVSLLDPLALALTAWLAWLAIQPLSAMGASPPAWAQPLVNFLFYSGIGYFPITVRLAPDDEAAFDGGRAYMLGFEPHGALPFAMPLAFSSHSPILPKPLRARPIHSLASSACFAPPLTRNMFWWCGMRPVSKSSISSLLQAGTSVALCPGGVKECLYMNFRDNSETAYLSSRRGFVRMALQHGAPLVPVFAFGQSRSYRWLRPGPPWVPQSWIDTLARRIGFLPLWMYGRWGSVVAFQTPIVVTVGRPIEVGEAVAEPSPEQVQLFLDRFIEELRALFDKHKGPCGYAGCKLRVL